MNQEELMRERYGIKPPASRGRMVAVAASLFTVFLVWAVWVSFFSPATAKPTTVGYEVNSASQTVVRFKVQKSAPAEFTCAAEVLDQSYAVVGYREVEIGADAPADTVIEVAVNTTQLGVTGLVEKCWLK